MSKTYMVNEIFYSLQGEGMRAGTANVFVRLSGCNQTCSVETHGFDCDTEFASGTKMTAKLIAERARSLAENCGWVILTGGEPGLQADKGLLDVLHDAGFLVAIETNGSVDVSGLPFDWVTVSPKVAEHAIKQRTADEVKYVRGNWQGIPKTMVDSDHCLISPAFDGAVVDPETMAWCLKLVKENPKWRLSVQQHKTWRVR